LIAARGLPKVTLEARRLCHREIQWRGPEIVEPLSHDKRGLLLCTLEALLLLDMKEQEVYESIRQNCEAAREAWSCPILICRISAGISEWKERNVGQLLRVSFRLGKEATSWNCNPAEPDGKPGTNMRRSKTSAIDAIIPGMPSAPGSDTDDHGIAA